MTDSEAATEADAVRERLVSSVLEQFAEIDHRSTDRDGLGRIAP